MRILALENPWRERRQLTPVMAGLVPAIHAVTQRPASTVDCGGAAWMAGTSPAMTLRGDAMTLGGDNDGLSRAYPHPALRATPGASPGGRLFSREREKGFAARPLRHRYNATAAAVTSTRADCPKSLSRTWGEASVAATSISGANSASLLEGAAHARPCDADDGAAAGSGRRVSGRLPVRFGRLYFGFENPFKGEAENGKPCGFALSSAERGRLKGSMSPDRRSMASQSGDNAGMPVIGYRSAAGYRGPDEFVVSFVGGDIRLHDQESGIHVYLDVK